MPIREIDCIDCSIDSVYPPAHLFPAALVDRDLTLTQLAYVVAIDTHRHFARAAEACNVTQPTLSMQIAKLERTLGVALFDRARAPVVPTDIGVHLIAQARVTLRAASRMAEIAEARAGVVAGVLRLGVIPTLAPYLLPRVIQRLAKLYPELELVIEERLTDDVITGLRRDTLDAGIVASAIAEPGTDERMLFTEPFVGYLSTTHRLARQRKINRSDLLLDDLWLLSEGHCFREQTVQLCEQRPSRGHRAPAAHQNPRGCTVGVQFESGNLETLKRLVETGTGMTLLPMLAALDLQTAAERRRIRPFVAPAPAREVRLVRRRDYLKQHLVEAVVTGILETLPDEIRAYR
ncbi:MAG: oxyR [Gemmatimonadetes bacterium]|nr:oxyR [Gemmatimonadota bacterium]